MPSTYAHYFFGLEVFDKMDGPLTSIIATNFESYLLGLQGFHIFHFNILNKKSSPEIVYYEDLKKSKDFLLNGKNIILESEDKRVISYLLGFICYFVLDSISNPIVLEKSKDYKIVPSEIESEFDIFLLKKSGKDPLRFNYLQHLSTDIEDIEYLSSLYNLSSKSLSSTLLSMKYLTYIYTSPNVLLRFFALNCFKVTSNYNFIHGKFYNFNRNSYCKNISTNLYKSQNHSINTALCYMKSYYSYIFDDIPLDFI